ncbi:MAG: 4Fe-4S dicluster domain-containing protein [Candidatus Hinthialibacter sp.]
MNRFTRWLANYFRPPKAERIDLNRRTAITSGLGGLLGVLIFRTYPQAQGNTFNPGLIRPPGSLPEREFLARCIKCGECMKVCPTNGIQPAFLQAGLEGMWTPVMNMKLGYCEYECTLCGQVCPTQAIQELKLETLPDGQTVRLEPPELTEDGLETPIEERKPMKIGQAFFDTNRCLPYAFARSCIVCEEHCPTSPKAIWVEGVERLNSAGEMVPLKLPHVDPARCVGCGICENVCPLKDKSGIYVTSAGESRNKKNQFLLATESDPFSGFESDSSADPYGGANPYGNSGGGSSPY